MFLNFIKKLNFETEKSNIVYRIVKTEEIIEAGFNMESKPIKGLPTINRTSIIYMIIVTVIEKFLVLF